MCLACEMEALWFAQVAEVARRAAASDADAIPRAPEQVEPVDVVTSDAADAAAPRVSLSDALPAADSDGWQAVEVTKVPTRKFICDPTSRG